MEDISEDFIKKLLDFRNCYSEYLKKYTNMVDKCLEMLYKHSGSKKRIILATELKNSCLQTINNYRSGNIAIDEIKKILDEQMKSIDEITSNIYTVAEMDKELATINME